MPGLMARLGVLQRGDRPTAPGYGCANSVAGSAGGATAAFSPLLARSVTDDWRVTSYSGLQQNGHSAAQDLLRVWMSMPPASVRSRKSRSLRHQFPAARRPGTFLHSLFEDLDFTQPVPADWMAARLQLNGFEESGPRC